jgi:uncharacterized membrane protein
MIPVLVGGITVTRVSWFAENAAGILLGFIIFGLIVLAYLLYRLLRKSKFEKELMMRAEIAHEYNQRRKEEIKEKRKRTIESRKAEKQTEKTEGVREPWPEYVPDKHLKDDERQIVNILKARESQCEQGTLRVVSGMPKSSLSRILKELEERNIIYKEKRGKKNMVFLR